MYFSKSAAFSGNGTFNSLWAYGARVGTTTLFFAASRFMRSFIPLSQASLTPKILVGLPEASRPTKVSYPMLFTNTPIFNADVPLP